MENETPLTDKTANRIKPVVIPRLFFVVATNDEDNWEQITQGLDTYEKAKNYRDSYFCKKKWEYAFIVCSLNEV